MKTTTKKEQEIIDAEEFERIERHLAYCFGRIQKEIEIYAESIGVSAALFTDRLGGLLQRSQSRKVLGAVNRLSGVRHSPATGHEVRASKMALAERSSGAASKKVTLPKKALCRKCGHLFAAQGLWKHKQYCTGEKR